MNIIASCRIGGREIFVMEISHCELSLDFVLSRPFINEQAIVQFDSSQCLGKQSIFMEAALQTH
jgi:hypothetical protein